MTACDKGIPAVADIPHVPTDDGRELVFNNPWEARAFALVVHLYQQGHFSWPEWAEQLSQDIRTSGAGDDDRGYYLLWLSAAEQLVARKALCRDTELSARKSALEVAQGGPAPDSHSPH